MANKVRFGISKAHYAVISGTNADGFPTYDTPVELPGAVSMSMDAQGDISKFYADNIVYYQTTANNGYEGDFEIALIPDAFRKDVLKEEADSNEVLFEKSNVEPASFALLVQFEGDASATRHVFYNCTATRPTSEASTIEDTKEPQTDSFTISAVPLENGYVKAKTTETTNAAAYSGWFDSVYTPDTTPTP